MVERKTDPEEKVKSILPSVQIQKLLLDVIGQTQFPGSMSEIVSEVKRVVALTNFGE